MDTCRPGEYEEVEEEKVDVLVVILWCAAAGTGDATLEMTAADGEKESEA